MIVAPAKTPKPIVDRLNAELKAAAGDPELNKQLIEQGITPLVTKSAGGAGPLRRQRDHALGQGGRARGGGSVGVTRTA